ncbi:hypothetical protein [Thalassotalea sp. PLHSN55]|uniref:hypothetical protein n=1 Tax=Thalassotalea sp. PLHSN55 TaxID=3435888 RepID=UPI003F86A056
MQVHKFLLSWFCWLALLLSHYACSESWSAAPDTSAKKPLQQYFLTFPPYWENSNDKFSGVHYRLAKALYKHANLDVEFVNVPYSRMQQQATQGDIAFINYGEVDGVYTNDILHVCVPPTEITLRVYYLDETLPEIINIEDFDEQNLIILHGLPLGNYESLKTNKSISFMRPRSVKAAIKGLVTGRGDYFIVFDNMMINAQQHFFPLNSYQLKSYPLYTLLGYPITTPKNFIGGKEICQKVTTSYRQLIEAGVVDEKHKILTSDLDRFLQ